MNKKSWFPLWIAVAIGLIVFIYGLANNPPARYSGQASGNVERGITTSTTEPSSGTATVTQTEWHGVVCNEPGKRIKATILRQDVIWLVRFDKNDSRILEVSPTAGRLVVDKHNIQEWMIKPGQPVRQCEVAWSITDDK
jgi:hypothetical protein